MKDIVGTWRLFKTSATNDKGEPMHPPYGEKPRGLLVFYADKRMMSVLCDGRSRLPAGESVREYNSYCGNYDYDGKTLVTTSMRPPIPAASAATRCASRISRASTWC